MSEPKRKEGWKNQIRTTLPQNIRRSVEQYAHINDMSGSEAVRVMVRHFIDHLPPEQREKMRTSNHY